MRVTSLAGGVGAARFLSGLIEILPPDKITVVVNTGDDFRWMGLYICPDIDTVMYTLAGLDNPDTGWGVRDETFHCLGRLETLGCEKWFSLGDRDLATHIFRTHRLQQGESLSQVTADLCQRNKIASRILPMTDTPVPTIVHTNEGSLAFQDYFVRRKCRPEVKGFTFTGVEAAVPPNGLLEAILETDAVVICPSNPLISIGPILAVPGIRKALRETQAVVLAISPIVAGEALKGPAAEMMRQLGHEATAAGVASLYQDFLDVFVLDERDARLCETISATGLQARTTDTVMSNSDARKSLAAAVMEMLA